MAASDSEYVSVSTQEDIPATVQKKSKTNLTKVIGGIALATVALFVPNGPAQAKGILDYLTGPLYEPIRSDSPYWIRTVVWNDFKLAVVFFVAVPLAIWAWSLFEQSGKKDAVKRVMFGYWQAASLLMFTVYLQIGAQPLSFATAASVQVLIPLVLWWWKDLSEEIARDQSKLAKTFKGWRLIATVLAVIGAITQILTTQVACTILPDSTAVLKAPQCAAWLEPPFAFKDIFHPNFAPEQLQVVGQLGAAFFIANFVLYVLTSLPRTGRQARSNKSLSYIVLAKIGFYKS